MSDRTGVVVGSRERKHRTEKVQTRLWTDESRAGAPSRGKVKRRSFWMVHVKT